MNEFPSNRHKDKVRVDPSNAPAKDDKKVQKIVESEVVRRKKPLGKRFVETFIGGDTNSVWEYVTFDVVVPAAKDMLADAVSQGVEKLIFGEAVSHGRRSGRRPNDGPYISYNKMSSRRRDPRGRDEPRSMSRRARSSHDFDEIILATRVEAEEVIDRLYDIVSKYEMATVSDLYDLVGITGNYTDNKWGWVDLRGAGVARVRSGYLLNLPRPEPLD